MFEVTLYGREVIIRSRVWFGPFHSWMYEVCDVSGGEPYTPIAVFDCVDDVWKYIVHCGRRTPCKKLEVMAFNNYRRVSPVPRDGRICCPSARVVGRKLQIQRCIIKARGTRTIGETMKYAIISDIHANLAALERVLADAERRGVERVVCAGDVVGYGPDPVGAIRILRERDIPTVMGNHDAAVAGWRDTGKWGQAPVPVMISARRRLFSVS